MTPESRWECASAASGLSLAKLEFDIVDLILDLIYGFNIVLLPKQPNPHFSFHAELTVFSFSLYTGRTG